MKINEITKVMENKKKGTFLSIGWQREIASSKAKKEGISVIKTTDTIVRWGLKSYKNTRRYLAQEAVKEALGQQTEQKEYKPWSKQITPYLLQHLSNPEKLYLLVYPVVRKNIAKVHYYINGVEATKQEVIDSGYCNASEFTKDELPLVMNPSIENITHLK